MAEVTIAALERAYDETPVLRGLSLDVADGEFLVLVGPSGCGKSTLLRCIAGLDRPQAGTISIDGVDVTKVAPRDRDIAMVFQSYALYPHLTVRENLAFGLKMRKTPPSEIAARVRDAAQMLELTSKLDQRPGELSGGQRQRVAMGRAVVRRPKVFLFDEPLSNLDAALRGQMRLELLALHRRLGATMIYVTHDQVEAMTLASRIAVLDQGRLQQVAPPSEIYGRPANTFVARFIGAPEMNLLAAADAAQLGVAGDAAMIGVRPEDVTLTARLDGNGTVDVVEQLGWESLVHVTLAQAARSIVARVESRVAPARGARVQVTVRADGVHRFDSDGRRRA